MSLLDSIRRIRESYVKNPHKAPPNEACTCDWVIRPLLHDAGYEYDEIVAQMYDRTGRYYPDYTILPSTPHTWYLEAKEWKKDLQNDHDFVQAITYAYTKGHRWAVLSNGREWRLYDSHMTGVDASQRLVAVARVEEQPTFEQFLGALSRGSVTSGELERFATRSRITTLLDQELIRVNSEVVKAIANTLKSNLGLPEVQNKDVAAYFDQRFEPTTNDVAADSMSVSPPQLPPAAIEELNPADPPDLARTSIRASFAGPKTSSWSGLVRLGVGFALNQGRPFSELCDILESRLIEGSHKKSGFTPVPGTNVSVQGMDANKAWRDALRLAQTLNCPLEVSFRWQDSEPVDIKFRGRSGVLRWSSK